MSKYKLILTVQDSFGMTKEIEAGIVDTAEHEFSEKEINTLITTLDDTFTTEAEMDKAIDDSQAEIREELPDIIDQNVDTIRYNSFTN